jgi:hypothetical protein
MLITEEYRSLNAQLHENEAYGTSGRHAAETIKNLSDKYGRDILDYGCGKRTLEKALGFPIKNYDPAIEGLDAPPEPAEIVVCGDVLEHIERDCLNDVLDDLKRVVRHIGLFTISTVPAKKFLADGRNAHLIVEKEGWWFPKIKSRFYIDYWDVQEKGIAAYVRAK